ncbi:putative oxidoreductase [compost metagenome]
MAILDALDEVAKEYKAKPAQIALAWLLARKSITAPIASATNVNQLHDLLDAVRIKLDVSALEKLTKASSF